jgi:hypothetical protein
MTAMEGQIPGSPSSALASPERASSLRDAASLTKWVKLMLSCWMGVMLIAFASHWALLHFLKEVQQGVYSSRAAAIRDAAVLDGITRLVSIGHLALFLLTAILFLRWVHRASENARRLGAVDMEFTPGWTIGGYFVPIGNLAIPYLVVKEIWNASASPTDWRSLRGHPIVRWWWGLFLAWSVVGWVALIASSLGQGSVAASILVAELRLVFDASAIPAGVAALLLVTRLRAIQMAHASSN